MARPSTRHRGGFLAGSGWRTSEKKLLSPSDGLKLVLVFLLHSLQAPQIPLAVARRNCLTLALPVGRGRAEYLRRRRVGELAAVEEAVDAQGGPARKPFATVAADIGFLSSVDDHVLLQVPLQAVGFLTLRTGEGPLAAVTHL